MKKLLLTLSALTLAAPGIHAQARARTTATTGGTTLSQEISYQTPRPDAALSCQCNELQRRLSGLGALGAIGNVGSFARRFPAESQRLRASQTALDAVLGESRAQLDEAKGKSWADQERLCSTGVGQTNAVWGEWQSFLAQQGIDSEYYRGVKADHPTIPSEGDLADNGNGRVCKRGQWWEEDRALWAISSREGICAQERYQIKQLLRGSKGDPGHRCFEYELK